MTEVIVYVALGLICFAGECHHALVGTDTKPGTYQQVLRLTDQPFYGGDVIQYDETADSWYAIHRVWLGNPHQRRLERLKSSDYKDRVGITNGCINVDPQVYESLKRCCLNLPLKIQ